HRQGRPPGESGHRVDQAALHTERESRPGPGWAVLLLPHLRQGDDGPRRGRVRGREGREAPLAEGTVRGAEEAAEAGWHVGERESGVPGKHAGTGDRVRRSRAGVLQVAPRGRYFGDVYRPAGGIPRPGSFAGLNGPATGENRSVATVSARKSD